MSKIKNKKIAAVKSNTVTTTTGNSFFSRNRYALLVFLVGFFVFANGIKNDYNLDDELVTQNHRLTSKGIAAIEQIFTEPYYKDASGYSYEYRPMVLLSFAIEHDLFGDNPHVSHFINVILYSLLCVFLFLVLRKLLSRKWELVSLFTVLLFAVHPTHTEIVDSIKNRDEIMALGGALLSLFFALKFVETKKWLYLIPILAAYLFALLSKQTVTSFVIFIPLALVLFRDVEFKHIFIVSIILLIPVFALIYISSLQSRIFFILAILAINSILYLLKYFSFEQIRPSAVWTKVKANFTDYSPQFSREQFSDTTSIVLTVIISLLLSFSALALYTGQLLKFQLTLCTALVLWFIINWQWKITLSVIIILGLLWYQSFFRIPTHYTTSLISLPFIILAFRAKGTQRVILLGTALLVWIYTVSMFPKLTLIAGTIILLIAYLHPKLNKYKYWIFAFATMVSLDGFSRVFGKEFFHFNWSLPILALAYFSQQKEKRSNYLLIFSLFLFVAYILFSVNTFENRLTAVQDNELPNRVRNLVAPSVISEMNRPLGFVEIPITSETPLSDKLGTSMDIAAKYLKLTIIPYPLSYYYGYKYIEVLNFWNPYPIAVFLLYLVFGLTALYFYRKKPIISFGIIIYLVSIVSVLPIFNLLPGMMADRYLFIPSLGFVLIVTYLLFELWKALPAKTPTELPLKLKAILGVLFLIFSGITIARNNDWKDRVTLFSNDIGHLDNSAQAHNLLAVHLGLKANTAPATEQFKLRQEAAKHFERALEIYPDFMNPSFDLGRTLYTLGEYDKAIKAFQNTIRIKPGFSDSYMNIAMILEGQGKTQEAIAYYQRTIQVNPMRSVAYANLSAIYFRQNNFQKALEVCLMGISAMPDNYVPYVNVGKIYLKMNDRENAFMYFEKAFQLNSRDYQIANTLYTLSTEKNDEKSANYYLGRMKILSPPPTMNNRGTQMNPAPAPIRTP